jgi:hypothetical protein
VQAIARTKSQSGTKTRKHHIGNVHPPLLAFYPGMYLFATKSDPTMYAGGLAVLTANLVIAGYVVNAFGEEEPELTVEEKRMGDNDASGPRLGAFKQRTD